MEIGETLLVTTRQEWRDWLAHHHRDRKEIWLIYYKKGSSRTGISYEESVEEALCFGWIDGTNKGINEETYAGRFTPRRLRSPWSVSNRARIVRLLHEGRMTEAGLAVLPPELLPGTHKGCHYISRANASQIVVAPLAGARIMLVVRLFAMVYGPIPTWVTPIYREKMLFSCIYCGRIEVVNTPLPPMSVVIVRCRDRTKRATQCTDIYQTSNISVKHSNLRGGNPW